MRNEAYLWYAAVTKDAAQHRSWTFYEAGMICYKSFPSERHKIDFCAYPLSLSDVYVIQIIDKSSMDQRGMPLAVTELGSLRSQLD